MPRFPKKEADIIALTATVNATNLTRQLNWLKWLPQNSDERAQRPILVLQLLILTPATLAHLTRGEHR